MASLLLWYMLVSCWGAVVDTNIGSWCSVISPIDWFKSLQVQKFMWSGVSSNLGEKRYKFIKYAIIKNEMNYLLDSLKWRIHLD